MAPKKKPIFRREDFMYELEWSEKVDDYFIDLLAVESYRGCFERDGKNTLALFSCQEALQSKFNKFFSYKHLTKKVNMLRKRFYTFHWILAQDGVRYNQTTNIISTTEEVWDRILKMSNFAYFYRGSGELKYNQLKCIFGPDPVQDPNAAEEVVVLISDDNITDTEGVGCSGVPGRDDGVDRLGINAHAFEAVAELEFANMHPNEQHYVINISSDSSDNADFDMLGYLNYISDSDCSRDTELSTANSRHADNFTEIHGTTILRSKSENIRKFNQYGTPKSSTASNKPSPVNFLTPANK
ncbi:PREDICTED: uncharacterized protein LOC105957516 [Erythranthe guttata]|uniref:uncharacterized protein LOC105957516 n=1 Tax=Erythranthe guttata TaxID=4155 RepID=UPI00064DF53A|nr:PREDICTED: uncharacterized protein LOC105957516 [Erythranthe guttata]|eukprot:XP_012836896.1 PREDICTED: uncharacterized protein LOC105957516 [Erythranthe guttata]